MKVKLALISLVLATGIYWATTRPADPVEEPPSGGEVAIGAGDAGDVGKTPAWPRVPVVSESSPAPDVASGEMGVSAAIERLRERLDGGDDADIEAARQALDQLLRSDSRNVRETLAAFANESDPRLVGSLANLLAEHLSVENDEWQWEVMALALDGDTPAKRSAALSMLASIPEPPPELLDLVVQLSREDRSKSVQLGAIQAIGRWANRPELRAGLRRELLATIDGSNVSEVRGYAIQVIALSKGVISPEELGAMVDYLENDGSAHNRALAALALGQTEGGFRKAALGHLESAFAGEENLTTRRNILTQIVTAGAQDAVAILERLPADDPLLEMDVRDYLEILRAGEVTPDKIYYEKFQRDAERNTIVGSYQYDD